MGHASTTQVAVIAESDEAWEALREAPGVLDELGIAHESRLLCAVRTPDELAQYAEEADAAGCRVFIVSAGALAAGVAARTLRPVLCVSATEEARRPEMAGTPAAFVGSGKNGARNAALAAAQILALEDAALVEKLAARRQKEADELLSRSRPGKRPMGFHRG